MLAFFIPVLLFHSSVFHLSDADGYQKPYGCSSSLTLNDDERDQTNEQTYGGRADLANGALQDQTGAFLDKAENMYRPIWDCSMEEEAQKIADQCPTSTPAAPNIYALNYGRLGHDTVAYFSVSDWIQQVESVVFQNPYNGDPNYREFANMMQSNITRYACASAFCPVNDTVNICLYNLPNIQNGQTIYTPGTPCTADSDCTVFQPATCKLNQWCPANGGMLDRIRVIALDMHNYRRSRLAKGLVAKNNGNLLPPAANMRKMRYDCELEKAAQSHADGCIGGDSDPNTRPGIEENVHAVYISQSTPYRVDAMRESVKQWWSQVRLVPGIGKAVTFKEHHLRSTIQWFTKMAWATTEWLGCAVTKCSSRSVFIIVCRYRPGGNIVNNVVYEKGAQCSCPAGYSCSTDEKLCIVIS